MTATSVVPAAMRTHKSKYLSTAILRNFCTRHIQDDSGDPMWRYGRRCRRRSCPRTHTTLRKRGSNQGLSSFCLPFESSERIASLELSFTVSLCFVSLCVCVCHYCGVVKKIEGIRNYFESWYVCIVWHRVWVVLFQRNLDSQFVLPAVFEISLVSLGYLFDASEIWYIAKEEAKEPPPAKAPQQWQQTTSRCPDDQGRSLLFHSLRQSCDWKWNTCCGTCDHVQLGRRVSSRSNSTSARAGDWFSEHGPLRRRCLDWVISSAVAKSATNCEAHSKRKDLDRSSLVRALDGSGIDASWIRSKRYLSVFPLWRSRWGFKGTSRKGTFSRRTGPGATGLSYSVTRRCLPRNNRALQGQSRTLGTFPHWALSSAACQSAGALWAASNDDDVISTTTIA